MRKLDVAVFNGVSSGEIGTTFELHGGLALASPTLADSLNALEIIAVYTSTAKHPCPAP